ncbi:helix-hairpin-helix domain-containing protein [Nitritalea halalkaliphila]|nr:helix-hairpin-helix domain-containing protein [Nitritalea halalkaliphila]
MKLGHKEITKTLKLLIKLMELHGENSFKIGSYQKAVNTLERGMEQDASQLSEAELREIPGIGKSLAEVIATLAQTGQHAILGEFLEKTPEGLLEVLELKGLGPKKVQALWKELGISSTHELMEACRSGQVAALKGFGKKTQESILEALAFREEQAGKRLYADIEQAVARLVADMEALEGVLRVAPTGAFRRAMEIIEELELLVAVEHAPRFMAQFGERLEAFGLQADERRSSPFTFRGTWEQEGLQVAVYACSEPDWERQWFLRGSAKAHLLHSIKEKPLAQWFQEGSWESEEAFYAHVGLPFIPAPLREGLMEFTWAEDPKALLEEKDLVGTLHNHSTYSDGQHTLREMAEAARQLGLTYLGISDHSRAASYAGGLSIEEVEQQWREIEALNEEMAPFRIFKGIESDILPDGSLDYPDEVLAGFDFVVSSIHSGLSMDRQKATERLIRAIKNPYTTILGHPTGRLLLRRAAYPIDHRAVIDACAEEEVAIEINANPWRLDLDWRWVHYALSKGVRLAINPDAHTKEGYADMRFGVLVGQKGGLHPEMTLNAWSQEELARYFEERKKKKRKQ